ncbi:MAG: hypothetical protein RL226_1559 [Bacteroidota bacterium]
MKHNYLVLAFLLLPFSILAEFMEHSRTFEKTFGANPDTRVDVVNMYGNVRIEPWEKDSIAVSIVVSATATDITMVNSMLNDVTVFIAKNGNVVDAEVRWREGVNFIRKGMYDIKRSMGSSQRLSVDVVIYMPIQCDLFIVNRFGDVTMDNLKGEFELELAHGDFRANDLAYVRRINAKYGKLKINSIRKARLLELQFMELVDIRNGGELFIQSSNSEIELENVEVVRMDSKNDDFRIDRVASISGTTSMSNFDIDQLQASLDIIAKFGEIRVDNVAKTCKKLAINGTGTDVILNFSPTYNGSFDFDFELIKNFTVEVANYKVTAERGVDKQLGYTGTIGKPDGAAITLMLKYGYVRLGNAR